MFRNFRALVALVLLIGGASEAQSVFSEGEFKPYDEIDVNSDLLTKSVKNRVLYFAHFTCPYCRQAHRYLREWGGQLPKPYELELVPAIGLDEHVPMAIAYYIVLEARPEQLREFEERLYEALQDKRKSPVSTSTYEDVALGIGISREEFRRLAGSERIERYVMRAKELTNRYSVFEVPTVVIANKYRTGPGRVYNEQQAFVSIMNGLISMDIRERYQR